MSRYFLRLALALVAIATSEMVQRYESCFLLCDRMKKPGPDIPYSLFQCDDDQICMQEMKYMVNKGPKGSIFFLHRYCANPQECNEHCRYETVDEERIMSCITCMNSTNFGPEGKVISQMYCYDMRGPYHSA